jgi:hypothetical protein
MPFGNGQAGLIRGAEEIEPDVGSAHLKQSTLGLPSWNR